MAIESFQGKVAVVTGGTSGIGKALAASLIDEGATVVITGRNPETLNSVATEIGAHGIQTDVTDAQSVQSLADQVIAEHGRVDILVNNAGVGPLAPFKELTLEDFKWVMDTNFWGVVHGLKSFLPHLESNAEGGHVVNTLSVAALMHAPGTSAYGASKAASLALGEVVAKEYADKNIKVLNVVPALVDTQINENATSRPSHGPESSKMEDFLPPLPVKNPRDVAALVITGLREGAEYVFTHPQTRGPIEARAKKISEAFDRIPE
ncbi:SDR family oxidoreductase [Corynebacterium sp. S7]